MPRVFAAFVIWLISTLAVCADTPLSALGRPVAESSTIENRWRGFDLHLQLTQAVPFRVFTVDNPPRLVVDFNEVDWEGADPSDFFVSKHVESVMAGPFRPGWSRLVLLLARPMNVAFATMDTASDAVAGAAALKIRLKSVSTEAFAQASGPPETSGLVSRNLSEQAVHTRQRGTSALRIMLDPGHGGIDPGAEAGGIEEADLMLTFAKELRAVLEQTGMIEVMMTRETDIFVPLEMRLTLARQSQVDAFISLHADSLAEGMANGATVYSFSEQASDRASRILAERHGRSDLLAGLDLTGQDDALAEVLMDMARTETGPRSNALADAVVSGLGTATGELHKRPRLMANFAVLRAPDIPSILVELGFLSSPEDRARLVQPSWRLRAAHGIRDGVLAWARADAAQARLLRQ